MLPENFNSFEFLQDVVKRIFLEDIREEFRDLGDGWTPDTAVPRSALRVACTPTDQDTGNMLLIRLFLYYFQLRKAQDLQAPIYGIPVASYDESFKYRPTITLYFKEDQEDVDPDYQPLRSYSSYKLMDKKSETLTTLELTNLATKIKSEFGLNNGYKWKKGKILCTYKDKIEGYQLRIFAWSDTEGKKVISKILNLENKTPDWQYFGINKIDDESTAFPIIPANKNILGKTTRLPRKRPVGNVRFTHATCQIWGRTKPVVLYCRTGLLRNGLVD